MLAAMTCKQRKCPSPRSKGCTPCICAQVLKAGDAVVAAARRPEQSPGLAELKAKHGDALQLVTLDVTDGASLKVWVLDCG